VLLFKKLTNKKKKIGVHWNKQAQEELMQKMVQQRMMMRGMNPMMMDPRMAGETPPQKEITPEEKAEMEKRQKDAEAKRRKEQIVSLKHSLEQKDAALNVKDKYLARVAANKDVLLHNDLKEAKTEWHKKAIQAELDELDAILEEEKLNLQYEKESRENLHKQLTQLQVQEKLEEPIEEKSD